MRAIVKYCLIGPFLRPIFFFFKSLAQFTLVCFHSFFQVKEQADLIPFNKLFGTNIQITTRWFFRIYYVSIGVWHLFGLYFHTYNAYVFGVLTTLVPFFVQEVIDYHGNLAMIFWTLRVWQLIWGVIIDSMANTVYINFSGKNLFKKSSLVKLFKTRMDCEM